jgi:hypothetical protein
MRLHWFLVPLAGVAVLSHAVGTYRYRHVCDHQNLALTSVSTAEVVLRR